MQNKSNDFAIYHYEHIELFLDNILKHHQGVSMPLERLSVFVFKFPFHTNVFMLKLSYIRAYGPTVSGRNPGTPELRTGAYTLIRPAHK